MSQSLYLLMAVSPYHSHTFHPLPHQKETPPHVAVCTRTWFWSSGCQMYAYFRTCKICFKWITPTIDIWEQLWQKNCHHFEIFPSFETFVLPVTVKGRQGFAASLTDTVQIGNILSLLMNCLIRYLIRSIDLSQFSKNLHYQMTEFVRFYL